VILYIETSAAAKLLFAETETAALQTYLDELPDRDIVVSSALMETELRRAVQREDAPQDSASAVLGRFPVVALDRSVFTQAGLLPGPALRSLDALHVAVALRVEAEVMITYDSRQIEAAEQVGMRTVSPA
jgi:predicted nucleic acid-binding protein